MPKIFIAEDYAPVRKIIVDYITRRYPQIQVEAFESCEEAFVRMKDEKERGRMPDLVLSNYMNHGRYNGLQLTERIRKEISKDIPIFIMSSSGVEKQAIEAGATGYLPKPFSSVHDLDIIVKRLQPTQQDS